MGIRHLFLIAALAAAALSAPAASPPPGPVLPLRVPAFRMGGCWISNLPLSAILATAAGAPGRPVTLSPPQRIALTRYLATLSAMGPGTRPELFPQPDDAVAYLVNAYLAWAIALNEQGSAHAADALHAPFPLDGGRWTLSRIAATLAELTPDEPRVAFFLAGTGPLPPLPTAPLEGYSFQWQLGEQARRTGAAPGFWVYDAASRTIHLPRLVVSVPGLAGDLRSRADRLLRLAPPIAAVAAAIRSGCGSDLALCEVVAGPPPA